MEKCSAGENGICYAYVCYSNERCNCKDKKGNPAYATIKEIKERNKSK